MGGGLWLDTYTYRTIRVNFYSNGRFDALLPYEIDFGSGDGDYYITDRTIRGAYSVLGNTVSFFPDSGDDDVELSRGTVDGDSMMFHYNDNITIDRDIHLTKSSSY